MMKENNSTKSAMSLATQTDITASAEGALATLANAVAVVRQELKATMAQIDDLLERRVKLYAAPLNSADISQFVGELIDHRAQHYVERLREFGLMDKLRYPVRDNAAWGVNAPLNFEDAECLLSHSMPIERRPDPVSKAGGGIPIFLYQREFENWHYFYLGSVIKEKLCAQILEESALETEDADAPSMDERRVQIKAITEEIAQLEANAARLRSEISRLSNPVFISAKRLQGVAGVGE